MMGAGRFIIIGRDWFPFGLCASDLPAGPPCWVSFFAKIWAPYTPSGQMREPCSAGSGFRPHIRSTGGCSFGSPIEWASSYLSCAPTISPTRLTLTALDIRAAHASDTLNLKHKVEMSEQEHQQPPYLWPPKPQAQNALAVNPYPDK